MIHKPMNPTETIMIMLKKRTTLRPRSPAM
jgi:hypothetical protein